MTKEEAINFGEMWLDMNEDAKDSQTYAFFEQAIEALKAQPCEDCVSREAAIKAAMQDVSDKRTHDFNAGATRAANMIKLLPPVTPTPTECEDCVSRDAVHNMLENVPIGPNDKWFNWLQKACLRLAELPTVAPKQRTGYWIRTGDYYIGAYDSIEYVKCSCCKEDSLEEGDYCPHCDTKMEGEGE